MALFANNISVLEAEENLHLLMRQYGEHGKPVEVNFRRLLKALDPGSRAGHSIHPYPAKLLVNIPQFFLSALSLSCGAVLLDPFCGSGTVLYEGQLRGLSVAGSDSNPLARLITRAKLTPIDRDAARVDLASLMAALATIKPSIPDVVNRSYWFSERISNELGRIRSAIMVCVREEHRAIFDVSFSATVRRVSYADPRLSVPVKINPKRSSSYGVKGDEVIRRLERLEDISVSAVFWSVTNQNIRRSIGIPLSQARELALFDDARAIDLADGSVDLAITSPPYVGAQKYIRASSLCLGWLGETPKCELRQFERVSIGREHLTAAETLLGSGSGIPAADNLIARVAEKNIVRARIAQTYLVEMREALTELWRTMKHGARLVLIVGPNLVAGLEFSTPEYLISTAMEIGFEVELQLLDSIESRGLMTKRNRTAGIIQQESVVLLRRPFGSA